METQGKLIKTIVTKSGKEITLRYPTMEDLEQMLTFINELSREDTFITFSGEQIKMEDEKEYLEDVLQKIQKSEMVKVLAFHENTLIGSCDITMDKDGRERSKHKGTFGITVAKEYRSEGIGKRLAKTTLEQVKQRTKIKLIVLHVYEPNTTAIKLYESLGFKPYGVLPKGIYYKGEYVNEISMYLNISIVR